MYGTQKKKIQEILEDPAVFAMFVHNTLLSYPTLKRIRDKSNYTPKSITMVTATESVNEILKSEYTPVELFAITPQIQDGKTS